MEVEREGKREGGGGGKGREGGGEVGGERERMVTWLAVTPCTWQIRTGGNLPPRPCTAERVLCLQSSLCLR